jgi:hypothetical protein
MIVETQAAVGATRDHLFPWTAGPVDPDMLKLGLMFERTTKWGTYDKAHLSREMRNAVVQNGRTVDTKAAEYIREAFGVKTLEPLRAALKKILPAQHAEKWLQP